MPRFYEEHPEKLARKGPPSPTRPPIRSSARFNSARSSLCGSGTVPFNALSPRSGAGSWFLRSAYRWGSTCGRRSSTSATTAPTASRTVSSSKPSCAISAEAG